MTILVKLFFGGHALLRQLFILYIHFKKEVIVYLINNFYSPLNGQTKYPICEPLFSHNFWNIPKTWLSLLFQQQLQVLYLKPIAYLLSGICYKHYKCLFLCTQGNNREVKYLKHACTSTLHLPMHTWTVLVCTFRLQVCITYHVFCYYNVYFWSC